MKSLSITKTGKVMLAVALVIFMLVAILGLAVYSNAVATAAADTKVTTVTATMTTAPDYHGDSNTGDFVGKFFYNESTKPLADGADFVVTYGFAVTSPVYALQYNLGVAGFTISDIKVGGTSGTSILSSGSTTDSGLSYMITKISAGASDAVLLIDGQGATVSTIASIAVYYDLTTAPAAYNYDGEDTLGIKISGKTYTNMFGASEDVSSNKLEIIKRATASITTTDPSKTYDATEATTSTTFTPGVSDTGNESRRATIVTTWSTGSAPIDAGTGYNVAVATAANNYYEATSYNTDFDIDKKEITITADSKTSVYSTSPVALSYTPSPIAFYGRDSVTVTYTGAGASISTATTVGDYTITPVASHANYTITPVNGTYTVTRHHVAVPTVTIFNNGATTDTTIAAGTTEEKTFNGKTFTFDYTVDPTDMNSIAKYTSAQSPTGDIIHKGTYTLTLTINANYYWGAEGVAVGSQDTAAKTFSLKVNPAPITVTLHHDAIEYLDAVPTADYYITAAPYLFGENVSTVTINQADFSTAYTVGKGVDTYEIYLANTNGSKTAIENYLSDYTVSYTGADQLTVNKKTINVAANWIAWATGDDDEMEYDAAPHGIVAVPANYTYANTVICDVAFSGGDSASGAKQTHVYEDEEEVTLTATFTLKGNDAEDDYENVITDNYNLVTNSTSKGITITRKPVTITADDKSTTYGSAAPAFTSDAGSVLISGDTYTTEGSMTTAYTATAGNANRVVNTYDIVPAGWANNDYNISYTKGTLTVNKKVVTFTWAEATGTNNNGDFSWVYDAGSHTIVASVQGAAYSETITVDGYTGDASATNVGDYSRTVTSLSDDDNYAITDAGTESEAYHITKAPVTVTITPATGLVYTSEEKTVFTVTVSGMIGTETLTYTYEGTNLKEADGTFSLNDAGSQTFTGMLATTYNLALSNPANGTGLIGNYEVTLPAAAENTIAKATFTPGAISYSGATVSWAATTGTEGSDVITFTYTVNKGATEKKSGSGLSYIASETGSDYVLAITFAGDRAANYNAIADQNLLEVFSITLADTAYDDATYGHPHNGAQIDSVTQYAFDGQTVPGVSDWDVAGYLFQGWYVDATDRASAKFAASNAVTATVTYVASWDVVKYNVTYKYKLEGASAWETYKSNVLTTYWTSLETVPTIIWFGNVGWNDAEAMNGSTKTILDYTSDRTYYTVYSFNVGNGDVDGSRSVTAADATMLRKYLVNQNNGYIAANKIVSSISDAWAIVDQFSDGTYTFTYNPETDNARYFLEMVADVNGNGEIEATDIFWVAASQIEANTFGLKVVDNAVELKATVAVDATVLPVAADPTSVTRNGEALVKNTGYTYNDQTGVFTLTAVIGNDTIVIKVTGYKNNVVTYTYKKNA